MSPMPTTALVMRRDPTAREAIARTLRGLGLDVIPFGDESHLYAETIHLTIAPPRDRRHVVIVAEATEDLVRDLAVGRSGNWRFPIVLVGCRADADAARCLGAIGVPDDQPTSEALRRAIGLAERHGSPRARARRRDQAQPRSFA